MTERISTEPTPLVILALIAIFVMVFVVAHRALKEMPLFGDRSGWMVAVCVAALSVIGLLRFFGSPGHATMASEPRNGDGVLDVILLPYVALAISILLMLLLLALSKWLPAKSAAPGEQRRAKPAPKAETITRKRQTVPRTTLRARLEK